MQNIREMPSRDALECASQWMLGFSFAEIEGVDDDDLERMDYVTDVARSIEEFAATRAAAVRVELEAARLEIAKLRAELAATYAIAMAARC